MFLHRLHSRRQTSRSSHQRAIQQVKTTKKFVIIISLHSNYILIIFQLYSSIFQLAVLNTWTQTTSQRYSRTTIEMSSGWKVFDLIFWWNQKGDIKIQFYFGINFNHSIFHQNIVQLSPWIDASMRAMQKNYPHLK